jgi:hypothetical protein
MRQINENKTPQRYSPAYSDTYSQMATLTTPKKHRVGITEAQKQALRTWAFNQTPRAKGSVCAQWFERTYGRKLSQSSVSEILSKKFEYLDTKTASASARRRQHAPRWPILEEQLVAWLDSQPTDARPPTAEAMLKHARELWNQIPEYQTLPTPTFSNGWLDRFKLRYRRRDGATSNTTAAANTEDFGSVDKPFNYEISRMETKSLRTLCGEFKESDIFNMDETGLFWRKRPFIPSPTQSESSINKENSRICLILCTNASGSDRLPLWVIGHSQMPQALRNVNLAAMECNWRHNPQAWLTRSIMQEWLLSFYKYVGDRRVLLLLKNHPDHVAAAEMMPPPSNVHIQYFPIQVGATDDQQPLTLGIIQTVKLHYRKEWLSYMAACKESSTNSVHMMSLYHAISWLTRIWRHEVAHGTIYKAFRKSSLIDTQINYMTAPKPPSLTKLFETVTRNNTDRRTVSSLENFASPVDEDFDGGPEIDGVDLDSEHVLETLAALDDAIVPVPLDQLVPTAAEAGAGLQFALHYLAHQPWATIKDIEALERAERMINRIRLDEQRLNVM